MERLKFAKESLNLAFALGNVKMIVSSTYVLQSKESTECHFHFANRDTTAVQI